MINVMEAGDRAEVREMLEDIISGPLEKINGKLHVLVQQVASVDTQVHETNGKVKEHEKRLNAMDVEDAKPVIHTVLECVQTKTMEQMLLDINTIKTAKTTEGKFMTVVRSNVTLFIIGAGLLVNMIIGLANHGQNAAGLENQVTLKDQIKNILKDDSTYMHNKQYNQLPKN
jgi:hypothetical protein